MRVVRSFFVGGLLACVLMGLEGCYSTGGGGVTVIPSPSPVPIPKPYPGSELRVVQAVSLDKAWEAAKAVVREMDLTVLADQTWKSTKGGRMATMNPDGQTVMISLESKSPKSTDIQVRVGASGTNSQRTSAEVVYQRMKLRM